MNWNIIAISLLEMDRTPVTHITGYFESVVPYLSDSKFKTEHVEHDLL